LCRRPVRRRDADVRNPRTEPRVRAAEDTPEGGEVGGGDGAIAVRVGAATAHNGAAIDRPRRGAVAIRQFGGEMDQVGFGNQAVAVGIPWQRTRRGKRGARTAGERRHGE